ncbi:hypothetical protein C0993_005910 [Termitomyces sp. T159_Od127]|nr:hypothetical protein C0993_005910 [Termitomyces sp. T159_Od127]
MAKRVAADPAANSLRAHLPGPAAKLPPASSTLASRASMLASVVPMLRRQPDGTQRTALLKLKLSSPSFLDTTVADDVTELPLYTITTLGPDTTIKRADPWDGDTDIAEIKWSTTAPQKGKNAADGALVRMKNSRWTESEAFLRRGSGRKFNIPNYAQNLKWKRQGNAYWCTTAAVKGPIAILSLDDDFSYLQFQIFATLHDRNDPRRMLVHHGVSILLLDYLLVTALFLVTGPQDWLHSQVADISFPKSDVADLSTFARLEPAQNNFSASSEQWRKIVYGEPIFPTRAHNSSHSSPSSSSEALTPTFHSSEQMIAYGHSKYQMQRSSSPAPSSSESEGVSEHVYFSPPTTRSQSPASESIFSPVSRGAAPSHTYLDPSYYNEEDHVPPVPPIPAHLIANSPMSHSPQIRPSSSDTTPGTSARRLPDIPLSPVPPLIPRPRSTPPRPRTSPSVNFPADAASGPSIPVAGGPSSTPPPRPHRQLPRPPQAPAQAQAHPEDRSEQPAGRVRTRSASQSRAVREGEKWLPHAAYHQRTLPTPPTSSSQGGVQRVPLRVQRVVAEDGRLVVDKDVDDGIGHWVGDAEPGAAYELPPPAYSSIYFVPGDPPLQGPASPLS